jgi:hypothetical protein
MSCPAPCECRIRVQLLTKSRVSTWSQLEPMCLAHGHFSSFSSKVALLHKAIYTPIHCSCCVSLCVFLCCRTYKIRKSMTLAVTAIASSNWHQNVDKQSQRLSVHALLPLNIITIHVVVYSCVFHWTAVWSTCFLVEESDHTRSCTSHNFIPFFKVNALQT